MQNEELQHVFNISEHQNHRYNGYYVSPIADRAPVKAKRGSPKKKGTAEMVTAAATKSVIKRRPKVKSCSAKAEDVINGVIAGGNVVLKNSDQTSTIKFRTQGLNNLNNVKTDGGNGFDSINSILSGLRNNSDANLNHCRLPLKASNIGVTYSDHQFSNPNELTDIRGGVTKAGAQKLNNNVARKLAKLDDSKTADPLPSYLSAATIQFQFKSPSTNSTLYDGFGERLDLRLPEIHAKDTPKKAHLPELANNQSCESKLFLRAKRRQDRRKWRMDNGTRHEALQRIRDCLELQDNLQRDLFPSNLVETDFDLSDSESSSEECAQTFQNHWFHSPSQVEFDDVKRNLRLSRLYNELRRQLYQIKQNKCKLPVLNDKFMKPFVEVARTHPRDALSCLSEQEQLPIDMGVEPLVLTKKKCALDACKNVALPCMPTCIRHALLCDKQMLFEQCRERDFSGLQCDRPVLNIKYHYPVCSVHSKPEFVLPDFSRSDIKYEDVRRKNVSTISASTYKTDAELMNIGNGPLRCPSTSSKASESKKRANNNVGANHTFVPPKHPSNARSSVHIEKREREKKSQVERKELKTIPPKSEEAKIKLAMPTIPAAVSSIVTPTKVKETNASSMVVPMKEEVNSSLVHEVNQNLLPEWVNLSESQLVDAKTLESTLQNEFVNGFDMNAPSIQSQIQDIINSESSLSSTILMGAQELPNYIEVEEMIEEVEITDETLDSSELGNQELVHSEDFNAVLKQLPPEAFNELFSEFTLSEG